jgi:hypothetical protein
MIIKNMKLKHYLAIAAFNATLNTQVYAEQWAVFFDTESFSYSEALPVYDMVIDDMEGDLEQGEVAFTHNQFEVGMRRGQWSLSYFYRYDYYLEFDYDTIDLVHRDKNELPVEASRDYKIDLDANHIRAKGIKLAWQFNPIDNLTTKFALSYLQADELIDGRIQGGISTSASNSFSGQLDVDYFYDHDVLLDRETPSPEGDGYSLDIYLNWQVNDQWRVSASFKDAVNEISWDEAPYTTATLTSSTVDFDDNGFLHTTPSLSGFEGYNKHQQRLPMRSTVNAQYALSDDFSLTAEVFKVQSTQMPRVGLQYGLAGNAQLALHYDLEAQAVAIKFDNGIFSASYTADDSNFKKAKMLGLQMGVRITW